MSRTLRALLGALVGLAVLAAPASAQEGAPVGGPLLGSTGTVLGVGAPPVPPSVVAHGWLVADLDTGEVLGAKNPHGKFAPASTLKILTAIALPPLLQPDQKLVPEFEDVAVEGSKVGLVERVGYPVDELFQALMMVSGNDVAMTLARGAGGPAAIEAMNAEAARLQAYDTRAVNSSGLDAPGQTSSAYDLALLARAGMASPDFRRWVSTRRSSVSGPGGKRIETYNHNKLLRNYEGALGIKNGYTSRAKASFVGAATRDGRTLVVTMMRTQPRVHVEAAALLDWGFTAASRGAQPVGTLVGPVEPVEPVEPAPEAETAVLQRTLDGSSPEPEAGGGLPLQALVLAGGAALLVLLQRRRRVVLARAAARARAPRPPGPGGGGAVRPPQGGRPAARGAGPSRGAGRGASTATPRAAAPRAAAPRAAAPRAGAPRPAAPGHPRRPVPRRPGS